ncbi:serine O-acetyltransferase [Muricoccus aerilatus]|uniref:serine O-acetyltransferase n=1 Tax=Muricoccus aerilatus TaxID=452982 RepID=UPI0005C12AB0|nr:serine O-acetyltransferase [Roseomonas aerilata]
MDRAEIDIGTEATEPTPTAPALWEALREEAEAAAAGEPALRALLELAVLRHEALLPALASLLAGRLAEALMPAERLEVLVREAGADLVGFAVADLAATRRRDPAARGWLSPFLYYKGFHALAWHRVAHHLWNEGRQDLARYLQNRSSLVFGVDIHPAVPVGRGVFIDHATGVVVGETASIGNDVSILQGVTLGGTGKQRGDRHPKVRDGVLLSAGAKVLGNIIIGRGAKVGAGSVVLADVPPCATVAGVPARVVGWCRDAVPALAMDQSIPSTNQSSRY